MPPREIVSSILLARNELLGVEELAVSTSSDLVDNSRFQIDENGPRHMLARARLAEERVESIVCDTYGSVTAEMIKTKS